MKKINKMNLKYKLEGLKLSIISLFFNLLVILTFVFGYYVMQNSELKGVDLLKLLSTLLIPVSIFATFLIFKENMLFARKAKVNDELDKILEIIQKNRIILNKHIDFTNRTKKSIPLDPFNEIHAWICEKDDKGNIVIENDKLCKMSREGKEIHAALINIINAYERLAIGVYYRIIDEDMAYDSMGYLVNKNYKIFEKYIEHLRQDHDIKDAAEYFE